MQMLVSQTCKSVKTAFASSIDSDLDRFLQVMQLTKLQASPPVLYSNISFVHYE